MIHSLEEFLLACQRNPKAKVSISLSGDEYFFDDSWDSENLEVEANLVRQMELLGILYYYGGILEVNPMGLRILDRMRTEGRKLDHDSFSQEISESKLLYHEGHDEKRFELG